MHSRSVTVIAERWPKLKVTFWDTNKTKSKTRCLQAPHDHFKFLNPSPALAIGIGPHNITIVQTDSLSLAWSSSSRKRREIFTSSPFGCSLPDSDASLPLVSFQIYWTGQFYVLPYLDYRWLMAGIGTTDECENHESRICDAYC